MEIKTLLRECTWLDAVSDKGWGCGYIGVPREHPWYGLHYDSLDVDVHGGLTWSDSHVGDLKLPNIWWLGFDTSHSGDNANNCPKSYVQAQVESLKQQALQVAGTTPAKP